MNAIPSCLLTEFSQPTNEIEDVRAHLHSTHFRVLHREWTQKIRKYGKLGLLSRKSSLINGIEVGVDTAYLDPEASNLALLRHWGMSLNELCAIEEQLERCDVKVSYLALATERRLETNVTHFTLFAIDHHTGDQALIFHRSDCPVEAEQSYKRSRSDLAVQ